VAVVVGHAGREVLAPERPGVEQFDDVVHVPERQSGQEVAAEGAVHAVGRDALLAVDVAEDRAGREREEPRREHVERQLRSQRRDARQEIPRPHPDECGKPEQERCHAEVVPGEDDHQRGREDERDEQVQHQPRVRRAAE